MSALGPLAWLAATALALPAPDTTSRDRSFCRQWLNASRSHKEAVMVAADAAEPGWRRECRSARHATLVKDLDDECRSWPKLMDFEVRAIIDRALEPCRETPPRR